MSFVDRETLKGFLPVLVLASLREKPRHGYGLCKALHKKYGEQLRLGAGTIYPLLKRLESKDFVSSKDVVKPPAKPQRIYSLTAEGKEHFKQKRKDISELFQIMSEALGGKEFKSKAEKSKKKK